MFDRIRLYFREELWDFPLNQERGFRHFWLKWLRIYSLAIRSFFTKKCGLSASSLTYYTIMSIVPLLAVILAIAQGFGYHETFQTQLLEQFKDHQVVLSEIFRYADLLVEKSRGGIVAGIGFLTLLFTILVQLRILEGIFNRIWQVEKQRSWKKLLSDYFSLMIIAPILFIFANSLSIVTIGRLDKVIAASHLTGELTAPIHSFLHLIPYGLFFVLFTFINLFIPNTKVHFASAAISGVVTGLLYLFVQGSYIYFQIGINHYGAIYGSMAAFPLFLIWLQISWWIILLGAQIAFAHQTVEEHEFKNRAERMSFDFKKKVALWIAYLSMQKGFLTLDLLVREHQIPISIAKPVLETLVACGILNESAEKYIPTLKGIEGTILDLIDSLERNGENDFPCIDAASLIPFESALNNFKKQIETNPLNKRLIHVSNQI